jgi:hypothetical protein
MMKEGETYRCSDSSCGCEVEVTKGAKTGGGGDRDPRCCCGKDMQRAA